jgi:hypothetical protein
MLTEFSLRALVDISKSRLGPYLRFLEFGLETVPEGEYWHQNTTASQDYTAAKLHAEHHVFAETGGDAGLLGEALSNLKSLEDIVVRDTMSYTRRREGSMAPWRSYGTATLFGEYGLDLFRGRASGLRARELSPFKAVLVVLQALASADARIHGIEILLRMGGRAWIGGLQVPIHLQPTLAPVLRHLKKLHLGAAGRYNSRHPFEDETNSFGLRKFMGFVPNLEELRFNGNGLEHDPTLERFLGWLSSPAGAQEPVVLNGDAETAERIEIYSPPAVQLGSLKVLSLGKLGIAPEALKLLICKFAGTLCDLQLWDLLFKVPPDVETREIKAIFRDMLHDDERPLNLKHLKFGRLCYTNYDGHQGFVRFGTRHESGKMTIEYQGSDWKSFLAENIQNLQAIVDSKFSCILSPSSSTFFFFGICYTKAVWPKGFLLTLSFFFRISRGAAAVVAL